MNTRQKVIIDCDPGIDDSLALMYALSSEELEVVAITIVCGNVPVELGVQNTFKVLQLMDRMDIKVYAGETKPLVREYVSAQDTHGMDGLGESQIEAPKGYVAEVISAAEYLYQTFKTEKDISIIALGPLTNLAKVIERDPLALKNVNRLVSMGGNYKSFGNCSPVAEYNYWCDPDAAKIVYENFAELGKKVEMVGLDVTREIVLTPNILAYTKRINKERGSFVEKIVQFYFDFHWEYEKIIGCVINDPLAVAYFIDPTICSGIEAYTTVETQGLSIGQTIVDEMKFWKKDSNAYVCTSVYGMYFMEEFIYRIFGGEQQEIHKMLGQL
ncbi:MAG: nucleoside hydrolase [bacterium]|nr:nucleoside hydrolase [bacterium]